VSCISEVSQCSEKRNKTLLQLGPITKFVTTAVVVNNANNKSVFSFFSQYEKLFVTVRDVVPLIREQLYERTPDRHLPKQLIVGI